MARKISGPVCLNHPDVPAVTNCATCRKPVCADCIVSEGKIKCCSQICLQNALASQVVVGDIMQSRQKMQFKGLLRRLVTLIIILLLAAVAWRYRAPLLDLFRQGKSKTEEIGGQIKGATDNYKKELDAKDAARKARQQKKLGLD
ncbi:MAG: hypothetical protein GX946_09615 [Oligosphaeraceae bacterium]|nr:hypothetical protein [Oligosphaeraceae bacterium]